MRVPLSWLRFAPIEGSAEELAEVLSNLGLVVDGVERIAANLDGIVVARVLGLRTHPKADRIQLVDVDAGDGEAVQICCGAFNFSPGDLVPLATLGTVMPDGMEIARRKLRGEWSNGMLCSAAELGLPAPDDGGGILVLPDQVGPPGVSLTDALGLEDDVVFELDVSPNRPDALSMMGVARDLAAALNVPFHLPEVIHDVDTSLPRAQVEVRDADLAPRFTGTILTGVSVGPSPAWLVRRLALAGMRSINNVVDVSNYVMLDVGQPNHAYDLDRLAGGRLIVRRAADGETVITLDGVERKLTSEDCVICDGRSVPVGIAGIMGGASSEISAATVNILLEAAYFQPLAVSRTAKRLGLFTEARLRFERGTDPEVIDYAIDRFVSLLPELRRGPTLDVRNQEDLVSVRLSVRTERVNAILGTALGDADILSLLGSIGFTAVAIEPGVHLVTVPSWRPDTEREIDVIEEIARLYGYGRIERTMPPGVRTGGGLSRYQRERRDVRTVLAGAGLSEAWTTTFLAPEDLGRAGLSPEAVEVENPLDRSESILRTSLLPGLLKAVRFNVDRQESRVRLFEVGRVFARPPAGQITPEEREDLAAIMAGPGAGAASAAEAWTVLADALRLDDVALVAGAVPGLHPTRGARIEVASSGLVLGSVGEVDPAVSADYGLPGRAGFLTVDLEALLATRRRPAEARPVSRYPASDVDLAFVVADDIPAAVVEASLRSGGGELVEAVQLFDVYRGTNLGPGRRSLAYHLRLRALDRTLTDAEITEIRQRLIDSIVALGGELRA